MNGWSVAISWTQRTECTKVQARRCDIFVEICTRNTLTLRMNTNTEYNMLDYIRGLSCKRNREKSILTFILCDRFPFCTQANKVKVNESRWCSKGDSGAQKSISSLRFHVEESPRLPFLVSLYPENM